MELIDDFKQIRKPLVLPVLVHVPSFTKLFKEILLQFTCCLEKKIKKLLSILGKAEGEIALETIIILSFYHFLKLLQQLWGRWGRNIKVICERFLKCNRKR